GGRDVVGGGRRHLPVPGEGGAHRQHVRSVGRTRRRRSVGPAAGGGQSSSVVPIRSLMALTTDGSIRVVTSPRDRFSATSRSNRRMILPLRVFGSSGVRRICRGLAIGPMVLATRFRRSSTTAAVDS